MLSEVIPHVLYGYRRSLLEVYDYIVVSCGGFGFVYAHYQWFSAVVFEREELNSSDDVWFSLQNGPFYLSI